MWTSSPIERAWRIIPLWCQIRTRRPSRMVYGSVIPQVHSTQEQDPVEDRQRGPDRLGQAHPPVAEPVDGDGPEPLLEEVAAVVPQVLAESARKPIPGGLRFRSPRFRAGGRSRPGRGLGLDLNLGRFHVGVIVRASRKL